MPVLGRPGPPGPPGVASTLRLSGAGVGGFGTSLPGSPSDGDIFAFDTGTPGVVWLFRYNAGSASALKWEFIGGPPLVAVGAGGTTSSNVFQTTATPAITLPRNGDYDFEYGSNLAQVQTAALTQIEVALFLNAVSSDVSFYIATVQFAGSPLDRQVKVAGQTGGQVADVRYRSQTSNSISVGGLRLTVTPIRVS